MSLALAGKPFIPVAEGLSGKTETCKTLEKNKPELPWAVFATYKDAKSDATMLQFIFLGRKLALSKTTAKIYTENWPLSRSMNEDHLSARLNSMSALGGGIKVFLAPGVEGQTGLIGFDDGMVSQMVPFKCN